MNIRQYIDKPAIEPLPSILKIVVTLIAFVGVCVALIMAGVAGDMP